MVAELKDPRNLGESSLGKATFGPLVDRAIFAGAGIALFWHLRL